MVIWFLFLGGFGVVNLLEHPEILKSFNPYYAYKLIVTSPSAILILGAVAVLSIFMILPLLNAVLSSAAFYRDWS